MDGNIHTSKARLVAKGFTQTYGVDYEETFSHVADIKAIRILISKAAFYDYEIRQMDVKIAFLNAEYGVATSIGYGVSNFLTNTAYSFKLINTAYPLPLDTMYRSFRTEIGILVVHDKEPKIEDKDNFELKDQFLKELCTNTFSGSDHEDANEHIEKVLEIVDLFHSPNITIDQLMLRAFPMSLTGTASHWLRNKPTSSIKIWEDLKTMFLSKYCPPARTVKKMEEINNFQQYPDENLYQA
ncbi:hypothetical protein Tco_0521948 [Tanacetum coccineum]